MWTTKVFEIQQRNGSFIARCVDENGLFIFRWRMFYDDDNFETFDVPVSVIEHYETFKALCRQFDTPEDARYWYMDKLAGY